MEENEQQKQYTGVWIPATVWEDERLNNTDLRCYGEVAGFNECWASNAWLAKRMRCSAQTASRTVNRLIGFGYLKQVGFNGRFRRLVVVRDFEPKNADEADEPKTTIIKNVGSIVKNDSLPSQKLAGRLVENEEHNIQVNKQANIQANNIVSANESPTKSSAVEKKKNEVAEIIDCWNETMGAKLNANELNIYAINRLRKKFGTDTVKQVIRALPELLATPYECRVADFVQLEKNWNKVMDWGRRRMMKQKTNAPVVLGANGIEDGATMFGGGHD